jgi:MFS family permease
LTARLRLLWAGAFAFFFSFFLLLGALPLYARALGVRDSAIGGVLGSFAFAAMLVRPWAGWAADRYGRRPLMVAGTLVFVVASLAYSFTAGVAGLLAVRVLHGCGMGLYPTAASAVVADLAPPERRGVVMGNFGAAANIAMAGAPLVGIALVDRAGFGPLFWLSTAIAGVAVLLTHPLPETARSLEALPFTPRAMVSAAALFPSSIVFLLMLSYGAQVTFLPIHAKTQDVNPGLFFLVFALVVTTVRGYAGRLSDRVGRAAVAAGGLLLAAAALVVLALTRGVASLLVAGALYGLGFGAATTALMAWCVDVVDAAKRGRALGTYYTALELGIGLGALSAGLGVEAVGFAATFLTAAGTALAGAMLALVRAQQAA